MVARQTPLDSCLIWLLLAEAQSSRSHEQALHMGNGALSLKDPETLEEVPPRAQKVPLNTLATWSYLKSFQGAPIKAKASRHST